MGPKHKPKRRSSIAKRSCPSSADKIGPASRRAFREQGGSRDHATKRQLQVGSRVELPPRSSYREPDPEVDFEGDTHGDVVKIKNDAASVRMDSGRMDWFKIADLRLAPSGHSHAKKKKSPAQLQREIDEVLGAKPVNRRKTVRHFSESKDKLGRVRYAVTYEDLTSHTITPEELASYRERESRGDVPRERRYR